MLPLTQADGMFVTELKNEIGEDHFLYGEKIEAPSLPSSVARSKERENRI
ncbi:hypothetical protein EVA_10121 [gut metagenome]|uniref:Uncharacterized protein n=1 Tax=gut metagenome TaxID=749906 RepID=J9G4I7_9ZZZZ